MPSCHSPPTVDTVESSAHRPDDIGGHGTMVIRR